MTKPTKPSRRVRWLIGTVDRASCGVCARHGAVSSLRWSLRVRRDYCGSALVREAIRVLERGGRC